MTAKKYVDDFVSGVKLNQKVRKNYFQNITSYTVIQFMLYPEIISRIQENIGRIMEEN